MLRDSRLSRGKKVGVDFGCKAMENRRFFMTKEYYGVDLDRQALNRGLALYPEAHAVHAKIEDADIPAADFAVCINVFGATNFSNSNSMEVVRRIVAHIAPGGVLLITLKRKNRLYDLDEHLQLLREAFRRVDAIPITLDLFPSTMAWLMVFYHFVKPPKDVENPKRLYCRCIGKR